MYKSEVVEVVCSVHMISIKSFTSFYIISGITQHKHGCGHFICTSAVCLLWTGAAQRQVTHTTMKYNLQLGWLVTVLRHNWTEACISFLIYISTADMCCLSSVILCVYLNNSFRCCLFTCPYLLLFNLLFNFRTILFRLEQLVFNYSCYLLQDSIVVIIKLICASVTFRPEWTILELGILVESFKPYLRNGPLMHYCLHTIK